MSNSIDFFPINTEQTDWATGEKTLSAIRHQVFVVEQGVPEDLEIDDLDQAAIHWIAWGPNDKAMGTVRLAGNKIGRMAVLEPYRSKGVGSTLLRAVIKYAVAKGLSLLRLDAQTQALSFYEDNGFTLIGDEFMDAGIPHRPMSMDLSRFSHQRPAPSPPVVNDEDRERIPLESAAQFAEKALEIADSSDRSICIFSTALDRNLYDNEAFCHAVFELATRHPNAQVRLLVRDTKDLVHSFHHLIDTYHRLLSHIELRKLNPERETLHTEFLVGDSEMVLYDQDPDRYRGYFYRYAPVEARRLMLDFDSLWESSLPDPEIRRLYI